MASMKPYVRDGLTGMLKYLSEVMAPPTPSVADLQLAHFQQNFARLTGRPGRASAAPRPDSRRGEREAYYNLYYMGHRISG